MITLKGQMLSQLFSYGADKRKFEFRAAELKGMMRYMYRIAYQGNLAELKENEAEFFGGAVGSIENGDGHASPIKLVVTSEGKTKKNTLLLHKPENDNKKNNRNAGLDSPIAEWKTTIKICQNKRVKQRDVDLKWYRDLLILTLMICGVGKRSRKGRGRIKFEGQKFNNQEDAIKWICKGLNRLTKCSDIYYINEGKIRIKNRSRDKRPTILEIRLGSKLNNLETDKDSIAATNRYLEAIDYTCHKWKKEGNYQVKDKQVDNKKERKKRDIDPIGMGKPRFASSLIIGFVHTEEGIYPIYTFVKAVYKGEVLDGDSEDRNDFVDAVEGVNKNNNVSKGGGK